MDRRSTYCSKHPHLSKGAAKAQLRSLTNLDNDLKSSDMVTYLCKCGWWHVGHSTILTITEVPQTVQLTFDGEYLWLIDPKSGDRLKVGKRRASGYWSFYTMGADHGSILDSLLGDKL